MFIDYSLYIYIWMYKYIFIIIYIKDNKYIALFI